MFIKGTDQYLQATKEGAFVQALQQAAKSDRLSRERVKPRGDRLDARAVRVVAIALWHLLSRPLWIVGMVFLAVALGRIFWTE